jgi:endopeptidase La
MDNDIINDSDDNIILLESINIPNILNKLTYYKNLVQQTFISTQNLKKLDILTANNIKIAHSNLNDVFKKISNLENLINCNQYSNKIVIDELQEINDNISLIFKNYGTNNIFDMLSICFGSNYYKQNILNLDELIQDKFNLINKFCRPISYKLIAWTDEEIKNNKPIPKNRIVEDIHYATTSNILDGYDLVRTHDNFIIKVSGVKFIFKNPLEKKTLIINTIVEDIIVSCSDSKFINDQYQQLTELKNDESIEDKLAFENFCLFMTLKDFLISDTSELKQQFLNYINQLELIKQKTIIQLTREFLNDDLYYQRNTIFLLLIKSHEHEYQYLSYLLYDLLTNDSNDNIDTQDQISIFDSFSWYIKNYFRDAMKQTINYTNSLSLFDSSKIPLEQQICLLKANEKVKAKAMVKLKEVKAKSEDSGAKARQYLESLLKIPFGIYKIEPILNLSKETVKDFCILVSKIKENDSTFNYFPFKINYNSVEVKEYSKILKENCVISFKEKFSSQMYELLTNVKRNDIISNVNNINLYNKLNNIKYQKLLHSGKKIEYMKKHIKDYINIFKEDPFHLSNLAKLCNQHLNINNIVPEIESGLDKINNNNLIIDNYMKSVKNTLNESVYGHEKAKRQIERIIGQWINGNDSGYCFGFEGPPGVGKTSLAKNGISKCLIDDSGNSRPFAFIALGGSSNSSTLDGHNYTYVGSTWGRIVDILMETKCMNPIIFIDELDKVSKTENGKEIIGILTHLIDPTQNDTYQDKYFSGIDLDLSKALFIFSYNDVSLIDRILLDRIHRVKFDYLTIKDKIVITKTYLLPEIFSKMGLNDIIDISEEIIEFIIVEYTAEPGVRKLKEILFEIIGEINLSILQNKFTLNLPIVLTADDIKNIYLKDKISVNEKKIHENPQVGIISGLWANAMGMGGILPIECSWCSSNHFLDLKLTGMQGDVMKESMAVAKTIATNLALEYKNGEFLQQIFKKKEDINLMGLHIHVPEGSTPKDGPSAGAAITSTLYSRFTNRKIRNDVAITGEICLQGKITAIGGLDLKIMGAIRAGVKLILFPKDNHKDFEEIKSKNLINKSMEDIEFKEVSTIYEVFEIIFVD